MPKLPEENRGGNERVDSAANPRQISSREWKEILGRLRQRLKDDRISFISAAVAFYILLGLFPVLGALLSTYGFLADPNDVAGHLQELEGIVPSDVLLLFEDEMRRIASQEKLAGFGLVFGILIALWGGSKAMTALTTAMNVAYHEKDTRNFFRKKLVGVALTAGAVVFLVMAVALLGALPAALEYVSPGESLKTLLGFLRWPILFGTTMLWLAIIYRYAPSRKNAKWRWITPGSVLATALWVAGSAGFSWYAAHFSSYSKTYGSIGVIILLLMWLYISAFAVMLGAELNAEMELQTHEDTTTGKEKPMGERGAYVADNTPPDNPASG